VGKKESAKEKRKIDRRRKTDPGRMQSIVRRRDEAGAFKREMHERTTSNGRAAKIEKKMGERSPIGWARQVQTNTRYTNVVALIGEEVCGLCVPIQLSSSKQISQMSEHGKEGRLLKVMRKKGKAKKTVGDIAISPGNKHGWEASRVVGVSRWT